MKKIYSSIAILFLVNVLFAQPILVSDSLHTGLSFNLYSLGNVNPASLAASGANATWDLSAATATLAGTVEFLDMADTPYEMDYPEANFAMKFISALGSSSYSLFNHSGSILEEVANNVGTADAVSFLNYRTALVFPFTFNLSNTDTYQKENQQEKTISNNYDAYGTFIANGFNNENIVRIYINDNGNQSANWWAGAPLRPLFNASGDGFILWELTSTTTGISEINSKDIFSLYPNPASNQLNVINKESISKIEIYDAVGKLQLSTTQTSIDISNLKPGVYFVKAFSEKGIASQKFVKK